jgi:capsular exopolysaccharide synthesis family protein
MQENYIQTHANIIGGDDEIDIKRLLFLFLRKWYWLLLCLILGTGIAFIWGKYKNPTYQVDTSLVVRESTKGFDIENMFMQSMPGGGNQSSYNEIEVLRSYTLNHNAVENLNWRTAWYKKNLFLWDGLYLKEPFLVSEVNDKPNLEGITILITPLSATQYQITVSGTGNIGNEQMEIDIDETGQYEQAFENEFFNFTLHPKEKTNTLIGDEYRFQFKNKSSIAFRNMKRTTAEFTDKFSDVVKLSMEGTEPMRDIHYLNELIRVYLELKLEQQTKTQKRSLEFISMQLSGISDSLNVAESNFTAFRSQNQIIDLSSQGSMVMDQLSEIEKEKAQSQMQLDYFKNLQSYLGKVESAEQIMTPSVVGINDPTLNTLVLKLTELYSRRQVLAFSARENNPTLILINQEIEQVNNQLRENLANLIDNAQRSIKSLDHRYNRINKELNNLPQQEQELINIQRQYELTSEIYTFMMQRRAELEISLAGSVVDIQIIDPAQQERIVKTGTNKLTIIVIGAFLGLLFPILIILLSDFFSNTIYMQEDVEKLTPITIIGNVLHSKAETELIVHENPSAPISESYRTIRTNLQYKLEHANEKIIGIHSISPSEGKTFNVSNLACILAMNDKKTIVIGADLRKPRLHKIFNVSKKTGLSNYLVGQATTDEIIIKTKIDNLWIIPSGTIPPNPAELLEREAFATLLEDLKNKFDHIIIDNAPVSMVTDGLITSKLSDLNLFILRYGVSKKDQLKYINKIAEKGVMRNPAIIINDVKLDRFSYGYSYSYKYAYGKGYS